MWAERDQTRPGKQRGSTEASQAKAAARDSALERDWQGTLFLLTQSSMQCCPGHQTARLGPGSASLSWQEQDHDDQTKHSIPDIQRQAGKSPSPSGGRGMSPGEEP